MNDHSLMITMIMVLVMIIMVTMVMTTTMRVGFVRDNVDDNHGYNDDHHGYNDNDDDNEGRTRQR